MEPLESPAVSNLEQLERPDGNEGTFGTISF